LSQNSADTLWLTATAFAQASRVLENRHHDRVSKGSLQSEASVAPIAKTNRKIQQYGGLTPTVSRAKVCDDRCIDVPSARVQQKDDEVSLR
jgi:hypothetical protein